MVKLILIVILLTPSWAFSFDGVFIMHDVIEKRYLPVSNVDYKVFYQLHAKESVQIKGKKSLQNSFKKETARKVFYYHDGKISFEDSILIFKFAYYYRGEFIMEDVRGNIKGNYFNSKEISFNIHSFILKSERLTFIAEKRLSIKIKYSKSMLTPTFRAPYYE